MFGLNCVCGGAANAIQLLMCIKQGHDNHITRALPIHYMWWAWLAAECAPARFNKELAHARLQIFFDLLPKFNLGGFYFAHLAELVDV